MLLHGSRFIKLKRSGFDGTYVHLPPALKNSETVIKTCFIGYQLTEKTKYGTERPLCRVEVMCNSHVRKKSKLKARVSVCYSTISKIFLLKMIVRCCCVCVCVFVCVCVCVCV